MADESQKPGVVETAPAAGEQSGVTLPAAVVDQSQSSAGGESEDQQVSAEDQQQSIPKERFDVVNNAKNAAEARSAELEQQLAVSQAHQQIMADKQQGGTQAPVDPMAQVYSEIGDEDFVSGAEVKKAFGKVMAVIGNVAAEADFNSKCPDYNDLVGEQDSAGKYRPAFQKAIEANPTILPLIHSATPHKQRQMAYAFAKTVQTPATPEQQAAPAQTIHPAAQAALTSAQIPVSPMALGGGGSLGKASRMENMTDEEFAAVVDQNKQEQG